MQPTPTSSSTTTPVTAVPTRRQIILGVLRNDRRMFWGFVVLGLIYGLGGTIANLMTERVFDGTATRQWVLGIGVLWVLAISSMFGAAAFYQVLIMRGAHQLRQRVAQHVLTLPIERINQKGTGEFIARVDGDIDAINNELAPPLKQVAIAAVALVAITPALAVISPPMLTSVLVILLLTALSSRPILRKYQALETEQLGRWAEHDVRLEESIAARDDMRANAGQSFAIRRLAEPAVSLMTNLPPIVRVRIGTWISASIAPIVSLAASVAIAIWSVKTGRLTVGQASAAVSLSQFFFSRVRTALEQINFMTVGLAALNRVLNLLTEPAQQQPTHQDQLNTSSHAVNWSVAPLIEIRDLTFTYPEATQPSLKHLSLNIPSASSVGIIGRTGAGKTTLVKLLARIQEPPRGAIFIDGVDVCDVDTDELRQHIGFVSQRTELLTSSLVDNVTLLDSSISAQDVADAFELLGVSEWIDDLPDGLDTILGVEGVELSAGETQLVAFARLLVRRTPVIILDEATSRLDPITEARIRTATSHLLEGRTAIVIAHRTRTLEDLDAVIRVVDGRAEVAKIDQDLVSLQELQDPSEAEGTSLAESARRVHLSGADDPDETAPTTTSAKTGAQRNDTRDANRRTWRVLGAVFRYRWLFAISLTCWGLLGIATTFQISLTLSAMPTAEGQVADQFLHLLGGLGVGAIGLVFATIGLWTIIIGWSELALVAREQLAAGQTASARNDVGRMPTSPGSALSLAFNGDVMMRAADHGGDVINFTIIGATIAIAFGQPLLGIGLVLLPTIGLLLGVSLKGVVGRSFTRRIEAQSGVGRSISNTIGNALTFKLFAAEAHATAHIAEADTRRVAAANAENIWRALGDSLSYVPSNIMAVAVFWFVVNGDVPIEQGLGLYTAITMTEWGVTAAKQFVLEFASLRGFTTAYQRLAGPDRNFAHAHPEGHAPFAKLRPPTTVSGQLNQLESIAANNLTVNVRSGSKALDDVTFKVTSGQLVVICGAIGSGKTTLLRVLAGLIPAKPDQIRWNGEPVADTSLLMRPPTCSYAPQIPMMLSGSVAENISLDRDVDVTGAITAAALDADLARLDGHATVIGHKGVKLSGGQIQRAAVARALAQSSQLLLLDDVSSALDAPTEREIWTSLRASERTVIASTYKRFVAEMADQIIVLDHGRVVANGTWQDVSVTHQHLFA